MLRRASSHRVFISVALALIAIVAFEASILIRGEGADARPEDSLNPLWSGHYTKEKRLWKKEIEDKGAERAYELFKEGNKDKEFGVAHTLAHIMGELIYEKEGIAGVAVCDSAFAFGCYHSFFGKAITENGPDVVFELDKECVKKWGPKGLGCPHGIGHGVLGFLGEDALVEALDICGKLSWKGPIGGCTSGVFMEYNFRTMQSLEGAEPREFDASRPLYPCDSVPKPYAEACYFELPAWLMNVFGGDQARAGEFCALAPSGREREACYKGLGNSIGANERYDAVRSIAACSKMPDREGELLCRAGAAWSFFAEPTSRERKGEPCQGLAATENAYCLEQSEIII